MLNIESVQQTLNLTLDAAYIHVFVPVEALIWIRSVAIVLLIVAHAMRHVQVEKLPAQPVEQQPQIQEITPELIAKLRLALAEVTVTQERESAPLQLTEPQAETNPIDIVLKELDTLLPDVSLEEITAVITAYRDGVQRRNICGYLHWGSGKYSTIVKPVLDLYEQLQKQVVQ